MPRFKGLLAVSIMLSLAAATFAYAQKKYGPGVTDSEIKLGQTMPYSGPASAYGAIGKTEIAFFQMLNEQGGVNGRKVNLISLDDSYSPPRAVEQVRKLVEEEQVLALFQTLGTPPNSAIHKYVNARKVPHVFVASGATKWADPKNFPWTIGFQPSYQVEAKIYARYIMKNRPNAKIGVLYQNDDYGKDVLIGIHEGFGDASARTIVAEVSYEITDPTVDSQIISLQASGADTLMLVTTPKAAAQAIRKVAGIGWKPTMYMTYASTSVELVLKPAGLENAKGVISSSYLKDPSDPSLKDDPEVQAYLAWVKKYLPEANPVDLYAVYGYANAHTLLHVLRQCGNDLTRESVMRQAAALKDVVTPMLLPGIRLNTSATDYLPIEQVQLMRFDGTRWVRFGELLGRP
jgi:branched-chain amino acid transport system substrate-binding protein